jgi:hypothetical protein
MDHHIKTRQEKKSRHYKEPYNQKSLRIQEAMREKEKDKKIKTLHPEHNFKTS